MRVVESRESAADAKRAARDSVFKSKFIDAEKAKLMSEADWKVAAEQTGIALEVSPQGPSPYKLA